MSYTAVLDGMDDVLQTVSGLRVADYKAQNVVPPMAYSTAPDIPIVREDFDGDTSLVFTIALLVSPTTPRAAERQIATLVPAIIAAFDANQTLSGVVRNINIASFARFDVLDADTIGYLGGTFSAPVLL